LDISYNVNLLCPLWSRILVSEDDDRKNLTGMKRNKNVSIGWKDLWKERGTDNLNKWFDSEVNRKMGKVQTLYFGKGVRKIVSFLRTNHSTLQIIKHYSTNHSALQKL